MDDITAKSFLNSNNIVIKEELDISTEDEFDFYSSRDLHDHYVSATEIKKEVKKETSDRLKDYVNPLKIRSELKNKSYRLSKHYVNEDAVSCKENILISKRKKTDKHVSGFKAKKGRYPCSKCEKCYFNPASVNRHFLKEHDKESYEAWKKQKKKLVCPVCKFESLFKSDHNRHVITHSNEKLFTCSECKSSYKTETSLKVHMRLHFKSNGKLFTCSECKDSYKTEKSLKVHMRLHFTPRPTPVEPVTCEICNSKHKNATALRMHVSYFHVQKSKGRQFRCDECNKTFFSMPTLRKHRVVHSSERPFKCDICQKGFKLKFVLKQHIETH